MTQHELKCWPEFFARILTGEKTFEARKDDRGFRGGDTLRIREWKRDGEVYTGREVTVEVTYLLAGPMFGVQPGWAVMGFTPPATRARAHAEGLEAGRAARDAEALATLKRIGMLMHEDSIIVQCGACGCGLADAAPSRPADCSCQPLRIRIDALLATRLGEQ